MAAGDPPHASASDPGAHSSLQHQVPRTFVLGETVEVAQESPGATRTEHLPDRCRRFRRGPPLDAAKFGHYVRSTRNRGGLAPSVSFHDLQLFYASALIKRGCSVKQVQLALGHKTARVTLDVYGYLWPGEDERVRGAIGRVFRATADSSPPAVDRRPA